MRAALIAASVLAASAAAAERPVLACSYVAACETDRCRAFDAGPFTVTLGDDDIELRVGGEAYLLREVPMNTSGLRAFHSDGFGTPSRRAVLTLVGRSGGHVARMPDDFDEPWALLPFTCRES